MTRPDKVTEYERIRSEDLDTLLPAVIEEVQVELQHNFTYPGKPPKLGKGVRFKFRMDKGYDYAHLSRWNTLSYGDQSNLFNNYLVNLVRGAHKEMELEIEDLKGMKVLVMWEEDPRSKFQSVSKVKPRTPNEMITLADGDVPVAPVEPAESAEPKEPADPAEPAEPKENEILPF